MLIHCILYVVISTGKSCRSHMIIEIPNNNNILTHEICCRRVNWMAQVLSHTRGKMLSNIMQIIMNSERMHRQPVSGIREKLVERYSERTWLYSMLILQESNARRNVWHPTTWWQHLYLCIMDEYTLGYWSLSRTCKRLLLAQKQNLLSSLKTTERH